MPATEIERVTARFAKVYNARDWEAMRDLLDDDIVIEERRPARGFPDIRGADDFVVRLKSAVEAVPDVEMCVPDWLALRADGGVNRQAFRGHDAVGGGEVLLDRIIVMFAANDRYYRLVFFEVDDEPAALDYFGPL